MPRRTQEISILLQVQFLLLDLCAMVCALWMNEDSQVTLLSMGSAGLFLLLSRIPYRYFPGWMRQLIQLAVGFVAIYWQMQFLDSIPLDRLFIRTTALLLPALFLSGSLEELGLLWFGCIGFTGYGGLFPGRTVFLPSFLLVLIVSILLLYQTRLPLLAQFPRHSFLAQEKDDKYPGNWAYRTGHFLCVLLAVYFIIAHFSLQNRVHTAGLIPVSFRVDQTQKYPELWKRWIAPAKHYLPGGDTGATDGKTGDEVSAEDLEAVNQTSQGRFALDEGQGAGNTMGQDLVFRAYTNARLYWVTRIYDFFDGTEWSKSRNMRRRGNALDRYKPAKSSTVVQNISIVKAVSRSLPYAYSPLYLSWRSEEREEVNAQQYGNIRRDARYSYCLSNDKLPPLPWEYTVYSMVPLQDSDAEPGQFDPTILKYAGNYRQLPREFISDRMIALGKELTAGKASSYAKAMAIRDYLRTQFRYTLNPTQHPENQEITDYFLFESKAGCCQHFAQAFTLLARIAGLPARLVLGYSPGNYNLLANCFEVYEYHGHAWTQIFVEPYGWLTFDGTPPSALQIQDNPSVLKAFLDPFGDNWKINTPELSAKPPSAEKSTAKKTDGEAKTADANGEKSPQSPIQKQVSNYVEQIYSKASADNQTTDPDALQLIKAAWETIRQEFRTAMGRLKEMVAAWMERAKALLLRQAKQALQGLQERSWLDYGVFVGSLLLCGEIWRRRLRWKGYLLWRWHLHCADRAWNRLIRHPEDAMVQINLCHRLALDWLELAGIRRQASADLMEYLPAIQRRIPQLAEEFQVISETATQLWYSPRKPTADQSKRVLLLTGRLRQKLRPFLHHHQFSGIVK